MLYWVIRPLFDTPDQPTSLGPPQRIFVLCAVLMLGGTAFFVIRLWRLIYGR